MPIPTSKRTTSNRSHTQTQVTEPPASGSASAQPEDRAPESVASATSGPWVVDEFYGPGGFWKIRGEDSVLCHVHSFALRGQDALSLANARLIAAAPELLDALKALLVAVKFVGAPSNYGTPEDPNPCFEARVPVGFVSEAEAAILRAEGRQ